MIRAAETLHRQNHDVLLRWQNRANLADCTLCVGPQALEALRKLRTEKVQEAKEMKLKLEHLKTHKDNADQLRQEIQEGKAKEETASAAINALEEQLQARKAVCSSFPPFKPAACH